MVQVGSSRCRAVTRNGTSHEPDERTVNSSNSAAGSDRYGGGADAGRALLMSMTWWYWARRHSTVGTAENLGELRKMAEDLKVVRRTTVKRTFETEAVHTQFTHIRDRGCFNFYTPDRP